MPKRTFLYVVIVLAVVVPTGLLVGTAVVLNLRSHNNAKCPLCGREFHIPEEHRGTIAEWTRDYSCPNCGTRVPAGTFYETKDKKN